jgi:hypothetical protein
MRRCEAQIDAVKRLSDPMQALLDRQAVEDSVVWHT